MTTRPDYRSSSRSTRRHRCGGLRSPAGGAARAGARRAAAPVLVVIEPDDVSLCFTDPGYDIDVTLEAPLGVLYQVWEGVIGIPAAVRNGLLSVTSRREVVVLLPDALRLSPVASYVRRASRSGSSRASAAGRSR